jgi:AcrR family transcriptional regulator
VSKRRSPAPDLARSIYLLWGHHPSPGRTGLTASNIIRAGIEIADAEGLDAASIRRVAHRLGVGATSLYGHIPGKDDLTALMVDAVYGELYDGDVETARRAGDWREAMRFVVQQNWDLHRRHPWLLDIRSHRTPIGPNACRKYETELRPLHGIGLSDIEMDAALGLVLSHVDSTARAHFMLARTQQESGMTDAEWWAIVGPIIEQVTVDEDLELSARVGTTVGTEFNASMNPAHALTFGIDTILAGIEARIDRS